MKDVSDGFARNRLIPCGDAEMATPKHLLLSSRGRRESPTQSVWNARCLKNIASVHEKMVVLVRKANEKGHLFAKIKAEDIVDAIREQMHVEIPASTIILEKHIGAIGMHHIPLKSSGGNTEMTLNVQIQI